MFLSLGCFKMFSTPQNQGWQTYQLGLASQKASLHLCESSHKPPRCDSIILIPRMHSSKAILLTKAKNHHTHIHAWAYTYTQCLGWEIFFEERNQNHDQIHPPLFLVKGLPQFGAFRLSFVLALRKCSFYEALRRLQ